MWDKGYILINKLTGHKMFIYGWDELKEVEKSFTKEFWDLYRTIPRGSNSKKEPRNSEETRMVQIVSGFFKDKSKFERNSLNAPVQGSAAIVTKVAGIKFFNWLIKNNLLFKVLIVNTIHDKQICCV